MSTQVTKSYVVKSAASDEPLSFDDIATSLINPSGLTATKQRVCNDYESIDGNKTLEACLEEVLEIYTKVTSDDLGFNNQKQQKQALIADLKCRIKRMDS
jgi:hypothetical protein